MYMEGGVQKASAELFEKLYANIGINRLVMLKSGFGNGGMEEEADYRGMATGGFCDAFVRSSGISYLSSNYTYNATNQYVQNVTYQNMTLISEDMTCYFFTASQLFFVGCSRNDLPQLNTNLKAWVTANDNTDYVQIPLKQGAPISNNSNHIFYGSVHLNVPQYATTRVKITTHNQAPLTLTGYALIAE